MSSGGTRRDIRRFEKHIDRYNGRSGTGPDAKPEDRLVEMLMTGGPALPAAQRLDSLKAAYAARGAALRGRIPATPLSKRQPERAGGIPALPGLAKYAAVAAAVIVILAFLSVGSAYAMPGNPLYSIKRAAESSYLTLVPGGQGKADAYASYADRRLDELEYVEERNMTKWYYPLYRDAQGAIEETCRYAGRLDSDAAMKATAKAEALTLRLETRLRETLNKMAPSEQTDAERSLERLRLRLNIQNGTTPSQDSQSGNQNGQQSTSPGATEKQSGSEQYQREQQQYQEHQQMPPGSYTQPEQQDGRNQAPDNSGEQLNQGEMDQSPFNQGWVVVPGQSSQQPKPPTENGKG